MRFEDVSVPEVYTGSWDFRFFLKWFWEALSRVKYDTEHLSDIYDPLKCPEHLLWMLGDTMGFTYDDRVPASFNRLVLLYFMQMIRKKGSKDGVTFAAELNLAQFNLISYGAGYEDEDGNIVEGNDILYNRLEDTSVPVNAAYVTPHTAEGYIEVVYFSTEKPVDTCIEYVRPLGMYMFQNSGVRFDARTKISIDARLTNIGDVFENIGTTRVADYTRDEYARMQRVGDVPQDQWTANAPHVDATIDKRSGAYYKNSDFEQHYDPRINPGFRALYSLQLCNNEHVVKALIDPFFSLGFHPQQEGDSVSDDKYYITEDDVTVINPNSYLNPQYEKQYGRNPYYPYVHPKDEPEWNLRYDRDQEIGITPDVHTLDEQDTPGTQMHPNPAVNPVMHQIGDAMAINDVIFTERLDEDDVATPKYKGKDTEE